MHVRIAVYDPLPVFRRGIQAILRDAGYEVEAPDDLLTWIGTDTRRFVWLTVQTAGDWSVLEELHRVRADTIVVAVLDEPDVDSYVRALMSGAVNVVSRSATPRAVRKAFTAAVRGRTVLPIDVLRALTAQPVERPNPAAPSHVERQWLRHLAAGMTVTQLAEQAGYSERMMFRLLRETYTKLGATNRVEALLRARDAGWLAV